MQDLAARRAFDMGDLKGPSDDLGQPEESKFDYSALDLQQARTIRVSAKRIRYLVKRGLDDVISIGQELNTVKEALPHGQFLPWIKAEFGWQERSARNFIQIANRFKSANVADLEIDLSAAYLLAAPSVPEPARQDAVKRAANGERITRSVAKEIIAEAANKSPSGDLTSKPQQRRSSAIAALQHLKASWPNDELPELVQLLREFADSLEEQ